MEGEMYTVQIEGVRPLLMHWSQKSIQNYLPP